MQQYLIITNSEGEKSKVDLKPSQIIPVEPGDDVSVYDNDGEIATVTLRPDDSDLKILFESGEHVTLDDFYKLAQEGAEPVTVSTLSQGESLAESPTMSIGEGGVGNLPSLSAFTLMRYSNTEYINFAQNSGDIQAPPRGIAGESQPEAPTAVADVARTQEGEPTQINLFGNDLNPEGGVIEVCSVGGLNIQVGQTIELPSGSLVTLLPNGQIEFEPGDTYDSLALGESSIESFEYLVCDEHGNTSIATVSVTIDGLNDGPDANNDIIAAVQGEISTISPLSNDVDPDTSDALTITSIEQPPVGGTLTLNPDGTVSFDPENDFDHLGIGDTATQTLTYTISDGNGGTDSAEITITIEGRNDSPIANPDTDTVDEDTPIILTPLTNDTDPDGDPLNICGIEVGGVMVNPTPGVPITLDSGAIITVLSDGSIQYDQNGVYNHLDDGETATDIFTYKIDDGNGGTATTTYTVTINGADDPTLTNPDLETTDEETPVVVDVLLNDSDPDSSDNPLTVASIVTPPSSGTISINPGGADVTFDPNGQFEYLGVGESATVTFTYETNTGATEVGTVVITGVNDGPIANPDTDTVDEDTPIILTPLTNDTDPDGDPLNICGIEVGGVMVNPTPGVPITLDSGAIITVLSDGSIQYDQNGVYNHLDDGETATDIFTYKIDDGNGGTATTTYTVTINGADDPTLTNPDLETTDEETPVVVDVLLNDSDPDSSDNPLTVASIVTPPSSGTISINPGGADVTFDPNGQFEYLGVGESATVTFTYETNTGATEVGTVVITGVNDGPIANPDTDTVDEDTPIILTPLTNDTDPDGDPLNICGIEVGGVMVNPTPGVPITLDSGAIITVLSDGSIQYDQNGVYNHLDDGETATDIFTYKIDDGNGGTATTTYTVTINGADDPTLTNPDFESTPEDTPVIGGSVLGNDSDPDTSDNPLTVVSNTNPTNGSVVVNADGTYTYTPNANFTGTDTFTYTTSTGATDVVTITVTPVNDPPIANPDSDVVDEDTPITLTPLTNDSDPDGDPLNICGIEVGGVMVTPTPGVPITLDSGAIITVLADGTIAYDQNGVYNHLDDGETATDIFTYKIDDGNGGTATTTYTVTINGADDATLTNPDFESTLEDTPVVGSSVLGNDSDPDTSDNPLTVVGNTNPTNGSVVVNADGTYTYTPNANFTGTDTFTYTTSTGATDVVTITVTPVNDPPIANPDSDVVDEDTPITLTPLTNDSDPDGDPLNICGIEVGGVMVTPTPGVPITLDSGAIITVLADGTIAYDQNGVYNHLDDGESATDIFTYKIDDGNGGTATTTYTVTINGADDATLTNPDFESTLEDTPVVGSSVLGNDSDPDTSDNPLTVVSNTNPTNGSVVVNADGTYTYTPNANFTGTDTFTYTTSTGATDVVTITVTPVNDLPDAIDDSSTTDQNTPVTITILGNDSDPEGDPLTVTGASNGANGSVSINPDGTVEYTPNSGFSGTDTFTYSISDGNGGTDTATVTVTINGQTPPVTVSDTVCTEENFPVTFDPLGNDTDPDGDPLVVTEIEGTPVSPGDSVVLSNGSIVTLNLDGTVTYDPNGNYDSLSGGGLIGNDSFSYTVSDGNGGTMTDSISVVLIPEGIGANENIGFALPDNAAEIYEFQPDTSTVPTAETITLSQMVNGEGMALQPSTGQVIGFDTSENIFHIDTDTGAVTNVGSLNISGSSVSGNVGGASFYVDPVTLQETFYVLMDNGNIHVVDPSNGNVDPNGFGPGVDTLSLNGDISILESIAIDPTTGIAYGTDDRGSSSTFDGNSGNADIYQIDLTTGNTTFVVGTTLNIDGEGLEFGNDGTLYIEEDRGGVGVRQIYEVDLATGDLTPATSFGGSGDVEGIAFNAGYNHFAPQILSLGPVDITSPRTGDVVAAKIMLTNPQPGDTLVIGALPPGVSGGVTTTASGTPVVTLYATNGTGATEADFEAAIAAVSYTNSTSGGPARNISVMIMDSDGTLSDAATGTIGFTPPIVIDLDGDGAEFDSIEEGALIDVDGDGALEQTAWASEDDAVLVFDANQNNELDGREEFVFADYASDPNATDMEGLREEFDTNQDGVLDAQDENFDKFKVWQDSDGDGIVDDGEMMTLEEVGIESIGLVSDGDSYTAADGDVVVHGESIVTYSDGTTTTAADASFAYEELVEDENQALQVSTPDGQVHDLDEVGEVGESTPDLLAAADPDSEAGEVSDVEAAPDSGLPASSMEEDAALNGAGLL